MTYRELAPDRSLADFVQCVWTYEAPADGSAQPIAPDGRCELIVHLGTPYREVGARSRQPRVLFAGQLTKPLTLVAEGAAAVVGVRFRPDGARAFFGRDVSAATDKRVDLVEVHGAAADALGQAARRAKRSAPMVGVVQRYVRARVDVAVPDPIVRAAVRDLLAGRDASRSTLSERQFERRFKAAVGVSPRMLRAILRFRHVFDLIERPRRAGWLEAALDAGYFDQPQMARDFRRFLGCTASEWATQRAGLARALAAPAGASD